MNYKEKVAKFFSSCDGLVRNVFFEAYLLIESLDKEDQPAALMYLCENAYRTKSDASNRIDKEFYTPEQLEKAEWKIVEKFTPSLNALIEICTKNKVEPIVFYTKAWELINSSGLKTKRERALALFRMADHELVPYRSVGMGLTMENSEYQKIVESLENSVLEDTEYILKIDYDQKTQRASLLVDRLLSLHSKEEQVVYLSIIMNEIESNVKEDLKSILDRI